MVKRFSRGRVPPRGVGAEREAREAYGERSAPRAGLVIVDLRWGFVAMTCPR